ncbi:long-chain-fatty-acid--CoA ligase [Dactylosporangium matsuzakiense]|uniref:AMP-dependent synthetase n=1 Tax=Dactylosporangium matsuzakiense TaxID=53360 RepID=A0A9W6KT44_9ACTN|nr:long-chain fatty acid--CoA ligase [Dactylosporangium matsuzakiense]UWZ47994.1 long-chain fatty acid--CoA ligase [Dactylosporangium matsuzakiense]GLL07681.1 AMP-dependent synthetase [Dactylosporangium matsuzakiense]
MSATLSLAAVLAESARKYPQKIAVVDGQQRVTYETLWREALTCAAGLRDRGVRPGDRVAVQIPNVVDFPRVYFGALALGAVVVPVHLLLTADEVAYTLRDSDARVLVCHPSQAATGQAAAALAGVDVVAPADLLGAEPLATYASRAPEDAAVVLYTSGTTGEPKGAVLTHLNLVMNTIVNVFDANDARSSDVVLGCLPLFHTFGQTVGMNGTFRLGATLVMLARFTGEAALDVMVRENVTVFHGVPTMYVALLAAAEQRAQLSHTAGQHAQLSHTAGQHAQLPQLRLCISGGAALPLAVLEKFNAAFGTSIFEGYGLSETSPTATTNQPHFGTRAGTVGHAIWGVEVEIARPEIEERIELLPAGALGEIVIRGHNVFAGYLNRPDDTAQAIVDGWFRSGDLGTKDADGFITIVDRKKDLVIRGGFNVYPREVEEAVARHPAVMQVAVIGVPDPVHGEEICAVVVRDPGVPLSEDELVEWSKERLGRHKYPRRVHFVEALPLGPSHKVLKRELRRSFS